jgi:hypothetical protein
MIELFLFAAAQAIQAVPLPPLARPQPVPQSAPTQTEAISTAIPSVTEAMPRNDLSVRFLPDLVVKSIRIENGKVHVQVANEGTGPSKGFRVDASVDVDGQRAETIPGGMASDLPVGASQWVEISGFFVPGLPAYPPPPPLALANANAVRAKADAGPVKLGAWTNPSQGLPGTKTGPKCTDEYGCIKELHEDNNELRLEGEAIVRGSPG